MHDVAIRYDRHTGESDIAVSGKQQFEPRDAANNETKIQSAPLVVAGREGNFCFPGELSAIVVRAMRTAGLAAAGCRCHVFDERERGRERGPSNDSAVDRARPHLGRSRERESTPRARARGTTLVKR